MKVTLLVSEWCPTCPNAERIWRQVHGEREVELEVLDVAQPEGRRIIADKLIKTIPSTLVDGELKHVGVPSVEEARELVQCAPPRTGGTGEDLAAATLTMQRGPRHLVRASVIYLVLAGLVLVLTGDLLGRGTEWLPTGAGRGLLHVFTYGFIAFMIFGVAEHMLPRFTGRPVRTGWLQGVQAGLLHTGLWLFVAGRLAELTLLAGTGAGLMWLGLITAAVRLLPLVWLPSGPEAEGPVG